MTEIEPMSEIEPSPFSAHEDTHVEAFTSWVRDAEPD